MKNIILPETYERLKTIIGIPDEYIQGKICNYQQLNNLDSWCLFNLDKNYLSDCFLIKDWKKFSFYKGYLLDKIFEQAQYRDILIDNIGLIWEAFNENKKELNAKENQYYKEKRYKIIPKIASLLLNKSKNYPSDQVLLLFKQMINELRNENVDYFLARSCAKFMGDYLSSSKNINEDIFQYLKDQQNIKQLDLYLIFSDWQIAKLHRRNKLDKIFTMLRQMKPNVKMDEIIAESIERSAFQIIEYISSEHSYKFTEDQLEQILKMQLYSFSNQNTTLIIENFQPVELIAQSFVKVYAAYKYSARQEQCEFYNKNIEYLKKKIAHDKLSERLETKNTKDKVRKI